LDDFGAGAASIDYLRRLPLDFIKVDGRYVCSSDAAGRDRLILRRLVELCHDLKLPVIAECVETAEVADGLRAM
jgi:EAL domain-containing protein (putative c-di-GMP-specific phosphodiesterase class I)